MGKRKQHILRGYQKDARDFLLQTDVGGCLFMEMRLGKTLTTIRYVKRLLRIHPEGKILVVGPNSTQKGWLDDLAEEGIVPVHIKGSAAQKEEALTTPGSWYLLNKEGYRKGKRIPDKLNKEGDVAKRAYTKWQPIEGLLETEWMTVILDESHFIKNPKSDISKFYVKNFRSVPYKVCLTGTPFEKDELDFIQQYLFVLGEEAKFDYWRFLASFTLQYGYKTFVNKRGRVVLETLADQLAFSLRRKDVNMDKEKIFEVRTVPLPPKALKIYKQVEEEFVLEFEEQRRITKFIIEQFSIMRRICGGFIPADKRMEEAIGEKIPPTLIHTAKIVEMVSLLEDNFKNTPVLIFATFISELELIYDSLKKKGMKCDILHGGVKSGEDRWELERRFKAREFDYFIVQPGTVKEGVDLSVASTAIYYSLPSGYITWKQTQDRILSLKKKGSLLLIILEIEASVETNLYKKIEEKTTKEDVILSLLRRTQKKTIKSL